MATSIRRIIGPSTITDPTWPKFDTPDTTGGILADFDSHDLTVGDEITAWPQRGGTLATLNLSDVSATTTKRPDAVTDPEEGTVLRVTAADQQFIRTSADLTADIPAPPLTIALRVKATTLPASGIAYPLSSSAPAILTVEHGASASLRIGAGALGELTATAAFPADQWLNLTLVYNGTSSRIYKDGVAIAAGTTGVNATTALLTRLTLGASSNAGGGFWNGSYRRVRVYGRALTDSQVGTLHLLWTA